MSVEDSITIKCECGEETERPGNASYWFVHCPCGRKIFAWIEDGVVQSKETEIDHGGDFVELPESLTGDVMCLQCEEPIEGKAYIAGAMKYTRLRCSSCGVKQSMIDGLKRDEKPSLFD